MRIAPGSGMRPDSNCNLPSTKCCGTAGQPRHGDSDSGRDEETKTELGSIWMRVPKDSSPRSAGKSGKTRSVISLEARRAEVQRVKANGGFWIQRGRRWWGVGLGGSAVTALTVALSSGHDRSIMFQGSASPGGIIAFGIVAVALIMSVAWAVVFVNQNGRPR